MTKLTVKCATCGSTYWADSVEKGDHHWLSLPPGWFADVGLGSDGYVVCSKKCARRFELREAHGPFPEREAAEIAEAREEIAEAQARRVVVALPNRPEMPEGWWAEDALARLRERLAGGGKCI
jgi:hypothetical protein